MTNLYAYGKKLYLTNDGETFRTVERAIASENNRVVVIDAETKAAEEDERERVTMRKNEREREREMCACACACVRVRKIKRGIVLYLLFETNEKSKKQTSRSFSPDRVFRFTRSIENKFVRCFSLKERDS